MATTTKPLTATDAAGRLRVLLRTIGPDLEKLIGKIDAKELNLGPGLEKLVRELEAVGADARRTADSVLVLDRQGQRQPDTGC